MSEQKLPFEVTPLGGHRWTLVRMSSRGVASHGVFESPEEAVEYATSLGEDAVFPDTGAEK
jgi:hypothetical protein